LKGEEGLAKSGILLEPIKRLTKVD